MLSSPTTLALALLALATPTAADSLPPAIAVADDAPAVDKYAAAELKSYLSQACPKIPFKVGPPAAKTVAQIAVGAGAAVALGLSAETLEGLGSESYYVGFFTSPLAGSIVLAGGQGSARGSLYAVYHMLMDVMNFDFLAHDETLVPFVCPEEIPHYSLTQSPAFEYRDDNQFQVSSSSVWATRVGYNGPSSAQPAEHGGHTSYASPPGFVHTSYALLSYPDPPPASRGPPAALYEAHPEWFWPRGAAGATTYGQLCWSNASLVAFVTAQARAILRAQPDAAILSVSQNDNGARCLDAAEEALNDASGSPIGALLTAVNTIAAALEPEFPHVAVDTLAYQWSRSAPTSGLRPRPNVIVRLCTIECDFAHPLTHPNNAPFQTDMEAWAKISNRTYIWDYVTNFRHYVAPFPNWGVLVPNIRYFAAHGVRGVFEEGTYGTSGGDLGELKDYLMARALWDPSVDADELTATFLSGYYSDAAAPHVRAYMDAQLGAIDASAYYMHESFDVDAPFLANATALLASAHALASASAAVASADVRFVRRVEAAQMPVMYVALFRWDALRKAAAAAGAAWPYNATKRPQFDEFSRRYAMLGMASLDEAGHNLTWMEAALFPATTTTVEERAAASGSGRSGIGSGISSLHWPWR